MDNIASGWTGETAQAKISAKLARVEETVLEKGLILDGLVQGTEMDGNRGSAPRHAGPGA